MLTRVRRCTNFNSSDRNEIINSCTSKNVNIFIEKIIGKGTFGTVYEAVLPNKEKLAVKVIKQKQRHDEDELGDIIKEVEYSYAMAKLNIGPKIFDNFYIISDNKFVQYIIMELGDGTVEDLINSRFKFVDPMLYCIRKQIEQGLYCIDIKIQNFVYSIKEKTLKVRMIDFGNDFCKSDIKELAENETELKSIIYFQLFSNLRNYGITIDLLPFFDDWLFRQTNVFIFDFLYKNLKKFKKTGNVFSHYLFDKNLNMKKNLILLINDFEKVRMNVFKATTTTEHGKRKNKLIIEKHKKKRKSKSPKFKYVKNLDP